MIEQVVEERTNVQREPLAELKVLTDSQIHCPGAWASECLTSDTAVEYVRPHVRRRKRAGVEDDVPAHASPWIADQTRPECRVIKSGGCVGEAAADISRPYRITVAAIVPWCEARSALGE